jgi:citrate lyase beta subunit
VSAIPLARIESLLAQPDADLARRYPGAPTSRQPVHSVYVPADEVDGGTIRAWGSAALDALAAGGGPEHLLEVHGLLPAGPERARVAELVVAKLEREPIEDLRIDLEDGYGDVGDEAEDAAADVAVATIGELSGTGALPPFVGIRFKSFERPTRARGLRTLDRFVTGLHTGPGLPRGLVLTLPKVTSVEQVEAMVIALEALEQALALPSGTLTFEIQVETSQAVLGPDGTSLLPPMITAGQGRVTGMPYGTYDYSASLGIAAGEQAMDHPAADHAKAVMQVATAGTAVRLSDGSTNVLPVGDRAAVDAAWALHGRLVTRSLRRGFFQGWDLHPAQLPSRYAATYAFFRTGLADVVGRLEAYLDGRSGDVMDEPATARAMASFLVRGTDCGAVGEDEIPFPAEDLRSHLQPRPGGKETR